MSDRDRDLDPEIDLDEPEDEESLPDLADAEAGADLVVTEEGAGPLALGRQVIADAVRHAPSAPGVYRMIAADGEVLYVGKAKNIRKRVTAYTRPTGHVTRIARMIAATASMEFVSTATETEALLLEANLIKRLRPRFNVLMRDDKSFPYILITKDHAAPQIAKHRGARSRPGDYFGPFASVWAVNRTLAALQRAFLVRSCSDPVFESRTRPCLLFQIKRCAGPCTGEVTPEAYDELVREARDFLSGRSRAVKDMLAAEMEKAAGDLEFERAAVYRDRLAALSAIQSTQGINPRGVEEADVFALWSEGGFVCVEVFFFRTGQNWGNRAFFPKADRSLEPAEVLESFVAQFYDDRPCPRLVLLSHEIAEAPLLAAALSTRAGHRVEVACPKRGEKRDLVEHAVANAKEALGRKLAESASQARLVAGLAETFGLPATPRRIEIYDNSHIMGTNAVGAMVVAGPEGFIKNQYRKFNMRGEDLTPGDDYGMMREMLRRRFGRLVREAPRAPPDAAVIHDPDATSPWPDLVLIDGGKGQLEAARNTLAELGITDVPLVGVAKGPDRDAGRETFHVGDREPFRLPPRDPVLYFVQRLRDEAHRFAIGSHRQKRAKGLREGGLAEIRGIGPKRKRALLNHFGTLKAIERASREDLAQVPGIDEATASRIYDFFHDGRT